MNKPEKYLNSKKFWNKTIKKDRWWDFIYFYKLLDRKLYQMQIGFKKYAYSEEANELYSNIKKLRKLLKKLIDDKFCTKCLKKIDKKYGKLELTHDDNHFSIKRKYETEENRDIISKKVKKCYDEGEAVKNKIRNKFFMLLSDTIETFWD